MPDRTGDILLVEDNPNDVELTLRAFEQSRITNNVHVARDGVEALDYLFAEGGAESIAVVLLDLKLPRLDGLEVLRRLRADERTKMLPVVVLTSSTHESDLVESYDLGVNSYIVKPVEFESFLEAARLIGMYWLVLNKPARPPMSGA